MSQYDSHVDGNQQFSVIGVIGTAGTADTSGTAKTLPIGIDPDTGAAYVYNLGPAGSVTMGDISGGTIDYIGNIGTMPAVTVGNATGGTLDLVKDGTVQIKGGTIGTISNIGSISTIGTMPAISLALDSGTISAGTQQTLGTVGVVNNIVTGTLASLGTVPGIGTVSNIGSISTIGTMPALSIGNATGGTLDLVKDGTVQVKGGTIGVVSNLTNGSVVVTLGTITGNIGTLSMVSAGTLTSVGTLTGVGVVSMLTAGTVSMINAGTITSVGTVPGIGVVTSLSGGTVRADGRPGRNILSYGTTFGGTAAGYGTLVGSASVGVGTSIWIQNLSLVNSAGTVTSMVGFGTAVNGTSVVAKGNFADQGGIQKSFAYPVNCGMTNQDLVCWIAGAGTVDVNVSYFIAV